MSGTGATASMVTYAEAQERAEQWINEGVPAYQRREVRVREFDLGFVAWAVEAEGSGAGSARMVIARDSGATTLWPALPISDVVRQYEEVYGRPVGATPAGARPREDLDPMETTSFLLTPPQWLEEAAAQREAEKAREAAAAGAGAPPKPDVPSPRAAEAEQQPGPQAGQGPEPQQPQQPSQPSQAQPQQAQPPHAQPSLQTAPPIPDGPPAEIPTMLAPPEGSTPAGGTPVGGTPAGGTPIAAGHGGVDAASGPMGAPEAVPTAGSEGERAHGSAYEPTQFTQTGGREPGAPDPAGDGASWELGTGHGHGPAGSDYEPTQLAHHSAPAAPAAVDPAGPPPPPTELLGDPSGPANRHAPDPAGPAAPPPPPPSVLSGGQAPPPPNADPGGYTPSHLAGPAPAQAGPAVPPPPPNADPGGYTPSHLAGPAPAQAGPAVPPPPPAPPQAPAPAPQPGVPTIGSGYMAVLRYRGPDGSEQQVIQRSAPGLPHPEWQILNELRRLAVPPDQVLELHTELQSCDHPGGYCARMVHEAWPNVRITHTAPYGREYPARQQGVQHLLEHQGEMQAVAAAPPRSRPQRAPLPPPGSIQQHPPAPPQVLAEELAQAFGPQGVFRFDQRAVARQGVPEVVATCLAWAGVPLDFGPFFWAQAQPPEKPIPTLAELAMERGIQPAPDAGTYLVIGNDFGRQLCVQYGTAAIVAVDMGTPTQPPGPEQHEPRFVNSGLPEFIRCMAMLGRMWRLRFGLTPEQAGHWTTDFQAQLIAIDPAALGTPETWWSVLLEQMWDGLL